MTNLRRRLHRLLAPMIYRDGTAIVPPKVAPAWAERQFIRRLLKRLSVDCVLDVGANEGQFATELRLIGYRGLILSFEPSPRSFRRIAQASASDPDWHAFDFALGTEAGEAEFNEMREPVFDSLLQPSVRETQHHSEHNQVISRIRVRVERLDSVLPDLKARFGFRRTFLKTDTQGFDLEVFRGAAGVHSELAGVQCELALKRIYEGAPLFDDALPVYRDAGFEVAGLFPVNPHEDELLECDFFFTRRE